MIDRVSTFEQLLATGMSASTIRRRYHRVLRGVYCLEEPTWMDRCYAVRLWQPEALFSHRSAARLYGWIPEPGTVEATVAPAARHGTPTWLTLYRRDLVSSDEVLGLPVVTREQALIDCVSVMSDDDAGRVVDERLALEVDPDHVRALIQQFPGRRGNAKMLHQLRSAATGFASEPERVLGRALIARHARMRANVRVGQFVADFYDAEARLVVEVDGYAFHNSPEVFRSDRRRQNTLVLDDLLVLRYAAYDVMKDPNGVADEIVTELRRRRHAHR